MKTMKVFKIKMWLSDGVSRGKSDVLVIILNRMELTKFLEWGGKITFDEMLLYNKIETQIEQQYDCNKREIEFKIDINN